MLVLFVWENIKTLLFTFIETIFVLQCSPLESFDYKVSNNHQEQIVSDFDKIPIFVTFFSRQFSPTCHARLKKGSVSGKTCKALSQTSLTGLCGTEVHQAGKRVLLTTIHLELRKVSHLSTTHETRVQRSFSLTLWLLTFDFDFLVGTKVNSFFPGVYAYIEASDPQKRNDRARLISPVVRAKRVCVDFWYHMYGTNMGWLLVIYRDPASKRERRLWYKSRNQHNEWHNERLAISSYLPYQVKSTFLQPCAQRWSQVGGRVGRLIMGNNHFIRVV